jgi:pimeloyl-ACP methyl ester carboxylesterase
MQTGDKKELEEIPNMCIMKPTPQKVIRAPVTGIPLLVCCMFVASCHSNLYYQPEHYDPDTLARTRANPRIVEIGYATSAGHQVSFYLAPESEPQAPPDRLWMLFGGLNAPALGWYQWFTRIPDRRCGLLFVEYPGYGLCEGYPRDETIFESSRAALDGLAHHFRVPPEALEQKLGLLGHSLGSATMLQFAPHVPARQLLLISPMTSLADQTRRMYGDLAGSLLSLVNPDKYDNRARLQEVIQRPNPPRITIIHGQSDTMVPVTMGRELAGLAPDLTVYYEIPGADHSGLIGTQIDLIYRVMFGEP